VLTPKKGDLVLTPEGRLAVVNDVSHLNMVAVTYGDGTTQDRLVSSLQEAVEANALLAIRFDILAEVRRMELKEEYDRAVAALQTVESKMREMENTL
jgi:hypothetical protein